jgi:hypothetical protein
MHTNATIKKNEIRLSARLCDARLFQIKILQLRTFVDKPSTAFPMIWSKNHYWGGMGLEGITTQNDK